MIQQEGWGWKTERSEVTDWIYISDSHHTLGYEA